MKASSGWRIHAEDQEICVTFWTLKNGDVLTIDGFVSRTEAYMFISTYLVLLASQPDKATQLLQEFVSRVKPS